VLPPDSLDATLSQRGIPLAGFFLVGGILVLLEVTFG
jgi:hypothetical protein